MSTPGGGSVTLKLATSLDGRIALFNGASQWITGEAAREKVHQLRSEHDVILTGIGTVLADDPQMTVRLPGYDGDQPGRVVLDTRLRLPETAKLLNGEGGMVLVFCGGDVPAGHQAAIEAKGAVVEPMNRFDGPSISLKAAIARIRELGGDNIMIEAGAKIAASALKHDLVDRIEWFRAPMVLGGDGLPVFAALGLERLDEAPIFQRVGVTECGADLHESYQKAR
ncbi:RibD family protein [Hyphobacterium sp.]|uniref:RibD family protein n=1 Tax=Hyphobacterium sp. TaxID=2004662 RepID=UPI003BA90290